MSKFKVGDKVVPHSKSVGRAFKRSDFIAKSTRFVEVVDVPSDGSYETVTIIGGVRGAGEYYSESDLTLYQEPSTKFPKKWGIRNIYPEVRLYLADKYALPEIINWDFENVGWDGCGTHKGCHGARTFSSDVTMITIEEFRQFVTSEKEPSTTRELAELPEKWHIVCTEENKDLIFKWRSKGSCATGSTLLSFYKGDIGYSERNVPAEYNTEITTEQFKKWVLCKDVVNPKETYDAQHGTTAETNHRETTLERARRLYPIGTKIKCAEDGETTIIAEELEEVDEGIIWRQSKHGIYQYIYTEEYDRWAEILEAEESKPTCGLVEGYWYEVLDDEVWRFIQFQGLDDDGDYKGSVVYNDGETVEDDCIYSTKVLTQVDYSVVERFITEVKGFPEPEQKGEVVHCTTQEEWDTVLSVFNPIPQRSEYWVKDGCINLETGRYRNIEWYEKGNYHIISFQEWCTRNGVTNTSIEVTPKTIELELKEETELLKPVKAEINISSKLLII